jgi:hypothetical protein
MEITPVSLESTPAAFQDEVNKQINLFKDWPLKMLAIRSITNTPYTDKTIVSTTYKAYFEVMNTMFVVRFEETTKKEWNNLKPSVDTLTIGDIEVFVRNSDWLRDVCQKAIEDANKEAPPCK